MSKKRMFEDVESSKFWELWVDGSNVFTRVGQRGGGSHTSAVDHGTADEATRGLAKQITELTKRGIVEAVAGAPAKPSAVAGDDLAQHLAALPPLVEDPAYMVFADWLQSNGQPWGELIALLHKPKKTAKAVAELIEKHGGAIIGQSATHEHSRFAWHLGFLRTATIGVTADATVIAGAVDDLLARPVAHMIEGVVINAVPTGLATQRDWDSSNENIVDPWELAVLAKKLPARVTHVGFGGEPTSSASAYLRMPSFADITKHFPKTKRLELTGSLPDDPGELKLPELVELVARFANASSGDLEAITNSDLPELERLTVWCGGSCYCILDDVYGYEDEGYPDSYGASDLDAMSVNDISSQLGEGDIGTFLDALPPNVTHLGLRSAPVTAAWIEAIAGSERIASLKSLDLSGGSLDDEAAKALIAAKKAFAHLAEIDLERNAIGSATAKKLATALPKAKVKNQKKGANPELFFRYVATME